MMAAILLNSSVNKSPEKALFPVIFAIFSSYPFLWTSFVLVGKKYRVAAILDIFQGDILQLFMQEEEFHDSRMY